MKGSLNLHVDVPTSILKDGETHCDNAVTKKVGEIADIWTYGQLMGDSGPVSFDLQAVCRIADLQAVIKWRQELTDWLTPRVDDMEEVLLSIDLNHEGEFIATLSSDGQRWRDAETPEEIPVKEVELYIG